MRLSDYFPPDAVARDGKFSQLDEVDAGSADSLVFCQDLGHVRHAACNPRVTCVITTPELLADAGDKAVVLAPDPRLAFFRLYCRLFEEGELRPQLAFGTAAGVQIHPSAVVSPRARIGEGVRIAAGAVIEEYCEIGAGSIIGPRAVIGAEGLLTVRDEHGRPLVVPHAGSVSIGRGVVILAGAVVARSLYRSPTEIGDFCQIGILSNIGHGARLGTGCVVSGNCVVAGRVRVGDRAWIGASSTIAQNLRIGEGARVHVGSVVVAHVPAHESVSGNFALAHGAHVRAFLKARRP